jgi:hypothetical protein
MNEKNFRNLFLLLLVVLQAIGIFIFVKIKQPLPYKVLIYSVICVFSLKMLDKIKVDDAKVKDTIEDVAIIGSSLLLTTLMVIIYGLIYKKIKPAIISTIVLYISLYVSSKI